MDLDSRLSLVCSVGIVLCAQYYIGKQHWILWSSFAPSLAPIGCDLLFKIYVSVECRDSLPPNPVKILISINLMSIKSLIRIIRFLFSLR